MTHDQISLFIIAGILLVGLLGEWLFARTGVPDAVWLIAVGAVLGPVAGLVQAAELQLVAPLLGALTIIIVLFHGGLGLPLDQLVTHAWKASKLAVLTFLGSVGGVALLILGLVRGGVLPAEWTWQLAVLTGLILGGSSSVVVMATLGFAKVENAVAQPLNVESALTDVLVVVCTGVMVDLLLAGHVSATAPLLSVSRSFGVGLLGGTLCGLLLVLFIQPLMRSRHAYIFLLAIMLGLYAATSHFGGSPALAVLAAAVTLGNATMVLRLLGLSTGERKLELSNTSMRLSDFALFIVKSLFFTFIGASLPLAPGPLALGAALGLVLLLVRWPAARLALADANLSAAQRNVAWVALPRGLAAGVMALTPVAAGIPHADLLPAPIFAAIVATILIFAVGFPLARRQGA
ncbi:K(+)/H(+) antiporter NhaP2 [Lacunisphaera limnophila]|uniref:K(+)/H(+) antiporter NhaP2 n=1 Tax=Lacunisphaera limnophila TaxID=1838286 RepID=A0A1D8ARY6_9BACT|nr:cation:proton antiporter [Lacunisphaera limnophila]AOS43629.1 K(+)/H(+) antiporter NhaP2 [Lacunisphaera limnophila]